MNNKSLWNCDTSKIDQIVCVLSKGQNLWLRGIIEKVVSDREVCFCALLLYFTF